jgi:hypothetical protein
VLREAHGEHERRGDERELAAVLDAEQRIRLARGDVNGRSSSPAELSKQLALLATARHCRIPP